MFNATDLLKKWNEANPDKKKDLDNFWKITNLSELMSEIAENELNFTSVDFTELKESLSIISKARMDRGGGTWMHPYLFLKFAMYLSPRFEYQVIKFVSDEMIKYRNDAGDAYRQLASALSKLVSKDFMPAAMSKISTGINYVIFGAHEKEIRNKIGSEEKQRELYAFEKKCADLVNEGFITSFENLVGYLRKAYISSNTPEALYYNQNKYIPVN